MERTTYRLIMPPILIKKKYICKKQMTRSMKIRLTTPWNERFPVLIILLLLLLPVYGQDSIIVFSDTSSTLCPESLSADSLWTPPATPQVSPHIFEWAEEIQGEGLLDFFLHMMGISGVLFILVFIFQLLIPVIGIALLIFFLCRKSRKKTETSTTCRATDERTHLLKKAIRRGAWGVGLILVESIFQFTSLLYLAGIILLCMAATNWLYTRIHKK